MAAPRSRTRAPVPGSSPLDPITGGLATNISTATKGIKPPGIFKDVADAIQQAVDFLKFIGWIFHPRNVLRAVEFLAGISLVLFGFWAAMQAHGERAEGFATSEGALSRSGLGRVSRELGETRGRSIRPREAPHATKRKAVARGRHSAAHGKPRKQGTTKRIAKTAAKVAPK